MPPPLHPTPPRRHPERSDSSLVEFGPKGLPPSASTPARSPAADSRPRSAAHHTACRPSRTPGQRPSPTSARPGTADTPHRPCPLTSRSRSTSRGSAPAQVVEDLPDVAARVRQPPLDRRPVLITHRPHRLFQVGRPPRLLQRPRICHIGPELARQPARQLRGTERLRRRPAGDHLLRPRRWPQLHLHPIRALHVPTRRLQPLLIDPHPNRRRRSTHVERPTRRLTALARLHVGQPRLHPGHPLTDPAQILKRHQRVYPGIHPRGPRSAIPANHCPPCLVSR